MKKLALVLLTTASLLVGCDQLGTGDVIKPTRDDKTFTMTIETIPASRITQHCSALGVKYDADGCAAYNLDTKHCTIYVVEPRHANDSDRFAVIGHEAWHCRYGEWHQ